MKTHSHLACVVPCFDTLGHDHRLNNAASLLSNTFYSTTKRRNNVRKGIKFDKKENYELTLRLDLTFVNDKSLRSIIFSISLQVESVIETWETGREESEEWNKKMERELARIGAFGFFLLCRLVHPLAAILYLPIHDDADRK